jgi:mono/diheme cytochrome c family protein
MRETIVRALATLVASLVASAVPLTGPPELPRHLVRPALADQAGTSQPDKSQTGTSQPGANQKGANPAGTGFDGEKLFATSCGWCHSSGGRVAGKGPKLAGTDKSDEFIVNRIKHGKPPVMPGFAKAFNDEQIKAIVAYIHSLKGEQS